MMGGKGWSDSCRRGDPSGDGYLAFGFRACWAFALEEALSSASYSRCGAPREHSGCGSCGSSFMSPYGASPTHSSSSDGGGLSCTRPPGKAAVLAALVRAQCADPMPSRCCCWDSLRLCSPCTPPIIFRSSRTMRSFRSAMRNDSAKGEGSPGPTVSASRGTRTCSGSCSTSQPLASTLIRCGARGRSISRGFF